MSIRYWIGVASRDHVLRGVEGGFAQVGHGKGAPLRRMAPGDWLFYYSPKTSLDGGEPLQVFTAAGRIADRDVYQVEMTPDFHPWRRDVAFEPAAHEAPIEPLTAQLSVIAGAKNWGMLFRRGHLEVPRPTPVSSPTRWGSGSPHPEPTSSPRATPVILSEAKDLLRSRREQRPNVAEQIPRSTKATSGDPTEEILRSSE